MALSTYTGLQAAVASWLARSDLTSNIPDFITLAQARINREVRAQAMETKSTSFTINAEYVNVPADFIEVRDFYITSSNPGVALRYMAPQAMTEEFTGQTGKPRYFAVVGSQFRFAKTPDTSYTATLVYYAKPATLATTTQETNILFPANADLFLYASLLEAEGFIQNDPRLAVWKSGYDEALAAINRQATASRYGGPLEVRPG